MNVVESAKRIEESTIINCWEKSILLNGHFKFISYKVVIGIYDDFHLSEIVIKNNKFSEIQEFTYGKLGIGFEQEEKLILEENDSKIYIISDEDVDGDDTEI